MKIGPETDGINHINVYSKGKTKLGRFLSNFAYSPFNHPEDGEFLSVEGYWYWLSCKNDLLRKSFGYEAKKLGRELNSLDWVDDDEFKRKIKLAIKVKLENNSIFLKELQDLKLPLFHYYVYSNKIIKEKKADWIIQYLETFKKQF